MSDLTKSEGGALWFALALSTAITLTVARLVLPALIGSEIFQALAMVAAGIAIMAILGLRVRLWRWVCGVVGLSSAGSRD